MSNTKPLSRTGQAGMTLIEVLVTVILISVGLLGVAALQLTNLRNNQEAYVRSQASVLASDILDRIRANHALRSQYCGTAFNATTTATSGTLAAADLAAWQGAIDAVLPGAAADKGGSLTCTGASPLFMGTVTIQWQERVESGDATGSPTMTFVTRAEL